MKSFSVVTKVDLIGGCTQVSIETSLPPGDPLSASSTKALAICRAAEKVAYVGRISSVTVDSVDRHEAAIGLKTADCIAS